MNIDRLMERLPLDQWRQLEQEWESNQRLRLGALAIWSLLLLYLCLVLSDTAAEARSDLVEAESRLSRLEAIYAQQYWLERAERSQAALIEIEASFPSIASSGRAEAQVRSMLGEIKQAVGGRKLRLNIKEAVQLQDGAMWQVDASVAGVVTGDIARDFLAEVETAANYGRMDRLKLVRGNSAKKVRVEVDMRYLFRAEESL